MNKYYPIMSFIHFKMIAAVVLSLLLSVTITAQNLTVATYNIRYQNQGDVERGNGWEARCPWICSLMRFVSPDLLGCQEVLAEQVLDLRAGLPGYGAVGVGRDDGKSDGEHEMVFYKENRFDLLDKGWFWLSENPDVPGLGWDAACVRICTWVRLDDKVARKKVWMFNLHMDHVGVQARANGAKLVVSKIATLVPAGETVFLCGDFNVDQTNEIYTTFTTSGFLVDSFETAQDRYAPNGTCNTFNPNAFTESRIDHIFTTPGTIVTNYAVLTETYRGSITLHGGGQGSGRGTGQGRGDRPERFRSENFPKEVGFERSIAKIPSDHFPVVIKVQL